MQIIACEKSKTISSIALLTFKNKNTYTQTRNVVSPQQLKKLALCDSHWNDTLCINNTPTDVVFSIIVRIFGNHISAEKKTFMRQIVRLI